MLTGGIGIPPFSTSVGTLPPFPGAGRPLWGSPPTFEGNVRVKKT